MKTHFRFPFRAGKGLNRGNGQILVEYGLLLLLIAIVVLLLVMGVGQTTNNTYSTINSRIGSVMK